MSGLLIDIICRVIQSISFFASCHTKLSSSSSLGRGATPNGAFVALTTNGVVSTHHVAHSWFHLVSF